MNLILLFDGDFTGADRVRLSGRRLKHVRSVHHAAAGDELVVGRLGGKLGRGVVTQLDDDALELQVTLTDDPPPPLPVTLVLALPRPKVLNRVIAAATSLGVKRIVLINAWRVEKSYWSSPRLSDDNLLLQRVLGLEQARDTILPSIELHRLFRPFVENELPAMARDTLALVAHPHATRDCPREAGRAVTLVIGPEGGFIAQELSSLERAGCAAVSLGPRVLRVETAVAALLARLF
ncbi:MAG TPA: 16S rRNA (uracil(1498)-N(3))-methyltransferase [Thermoanaerobaculia bacterium]